jgi:methylglutaconyl-CoA hydratase
MNTGLLQESTGGIARLTLNRPDRRNAFDGSLLAELCNAFLRWGQDSSVRAIVLAGAGPAFCAGADLRWMNPNPPVSEAQAAEDAALLSRLYQTIDECPCPVIGRVHGSVFGGGVGLVAVCDVAVAAEETTFALSEARLGLVPAVILPFLLRKAGESFVRRYALTGELFTAAVAKEFHLVHDLAESDQLDKRLGEIIELILRLGPQAVRRTKALFHRILPLPPGDRRPVCAKANTDARLSAEAKEGLDAFLNKRPPAWAPK